MVDAVDTDYRGRTWSQHQGIPAVFFLTHTAGSTRISLQGKLLTTSCETRTARLLQYWLWHQLLCSLVTSGKLPLPCLAKQPLVG